MREDAGSIIFETYKHWDCHRKLAKRARYEDALITRSAKRKTKKLGNNFKRVGCPGPR